MCYNFHVVKIKFWSGMSQILQSIVLLEGNREESVSSKLKTLKSQEKQIVFFIFLLLFTGHLAKLIKAMVTYEAF